jgi:hypothetical protein
MFDQYGHNQVLKFLVRKLIPSVVVYVVKDTGPLDVHMCLIWWVLCSLVVFCAVLT